MTNAGDILAAAEQLHCWVVRAKYRAYEPFDGLNSWLRPIARGRLARQLVIQLVLRSPVNLRPLLGIAPDTSTKAMGYFARGYLKLFQVTNDATWLEAADHCLAWLRNNLSANQPGASWGNHFDYQTRGYYLPKGQPTVVWTSAVGHAFVEAYELLGRERDLETAREAARFILDGLPRRAEGRGSCVSYVPGAYVAIHNANLQAAGFLARVYRHTRDEALRRTAASSVAYTADCQRSEGFWWYGEDPRFHWVDNWHTANLLDGLWWYSEYAGDPTYLPQFRSGARFWLDHCASQAIESLCLYGTRADSSCLDLARRVADWTMRNMRGEDGHFYFRRYPLWTDRTPMLHWGQATMLHGLASLLVSLSRIDGGVSTNDVRTGWRL